MDIRVTSARVAAGIDAELYRTGRTDDGRWCEVAACSQVWSWEVVQCPSAAITNLMRESSIGACSMVVR